VADPLPSWNDGATRSAIAAFVDTVTDESAPGFVPVEERVAVFDNDGTLWCEKPMPVELGFILERLAAMADDDASLRVRQPWRAAYDRDYAWLGGVMTKHYAGDDSDVRVLLTGVLAAFAEWTVEAYQAEADAYLREARHPTLGRLLRECTYQPMVELLRYLEANGFTAYVASGGSRDFMRSVADAIYGIPPERVIGSSSALEYRADDHGGSVVYHAQPDVFDDGPAKPVRIWSRIGRRPILAVGNSNGDVPMLRFASHPSRPSLSLLVRHDDAEREFAGDSGAEHALREAAALGWGLVSMRADWLRVFDG
jgi:phosphoserine phosphatase